MLEQYQTNARLNLADEYIRFTNKNVFLTGKAGTGKTTFLKNIRLKSPKRIVVVAPTGVAAINAGGVTIHSFFQLSFGPNIPNQHENQAGRRFTKDKIIAIKAVDLLVIDEISMVRADVLDAIDDVLRRFRDRSKPFGGVQLLMIGDLHQLSPIIKDEEWLMLRPYYNSVYFFESRALASSNFITIELDHIFRQQDEKFINLLNKIRDKNFDQESIKVLNNRYFPNFEPAKGDDYITLCTHNYAAANINQAKLKTLNTKLYTFEAETSGEFPDHMYPNEQKLELKVGAQIMFVKNDTNRERRYFNGKIGEITGIGAGAITVSCKGEKDDITVTKATWENIKYQLAEDKTMQEEVIGTFMQYPMKAAWAITIHKSQGLTFERAIIDAAGSFAHGQVYVALSRCKTLEGLILSTPIGLESIKSDKTIHSFDETAAQQDLSENALAQAKHKSQTEWITELFDFRWVKNNLTNLYKAIEQANKQLKTNTLTDFVAINTNFRIEVGDILDKFNLQLVAMLQTETLPEENQNLQERIKKGSMYLYEKINNLIYLPIQKLDLDCDNQDTKNLLNNTREQASKNLFEKLSLLEICKLGFESTKYLQTKANSNIDFEQEQIRKAQEKSKKSGSAKTSNNELFYRLKQWRDFTADEKNVDRYMVLAQKTLENLANEIPGNKAALAKISGLGKIKIQQYGLEILEVINEFCEENGIKSNSKIETQAKAEKPEKPQKGETFELSFKLFKEGKTIKEIAEIRNFAQGTIEGHLYRYLAAGQLNIDDLMDLEKAKKLRDFIIENPEMTSSEIKTATDDTYGYGEIRLVTIWMQQEAII